MKYDYPLLVITRNLSGRVALGMAYDNAGLRQVGINANPDSYFFKKFGATPSLPSNAGGIQSIMVEGREYAFTTKKIENLRAGEGTAHGAQIIIKLLAPTRADLAQEQDVKPLAVDVFCSYPRTENDRLVLEYPKTTDTITLETVRTNKLVIFGSVARRAKRSYFHDIFGARMGGGDTLDFNEIYAVDVDGSQLGVGGGQYQYDYDDDLLRITAPVRFGLNNGRIDFYTGTSRLIQQADTRLLYAGGDSELKNDYYDVPAYQDVTCDLENTDGGLDGYLRGGVIGSKAELMVLRVGINEALGQNKAQIVRSGKIREVSGDATKLTLTIGDERRNFEREVLRTAAEDGYTEIADTMLPIAYGRNKVQCISAEDESNRYIFADGAFASYVVHQVFWFDDKIKRVIAPGHYSTARQGVIDFAPEKAYALDTNMQVRGAVASFREIGDLFTLHNGQRALIKDSRYELKEGVYTFKPPETQSSAPTKTEKQIELDEVNRGSGTAAEKSEKRREIEAKYAEKGNDGDLVYLGNFAAGQEIIFRYEIKSDIYVDFTSSRLVTDASTGGVRSSDILVDIVQKYTELTFANDFEVAEINAQTFHRCNFYAKEGTLLQIIQALTEGAFLYFFVSARNNYAIRQYDFSNASIETITADISMNSRADAQNYASVVYINYNIDPTVEGKRETAYSDRYYKDAIARYGVAKAKVYDSLLVERADAQALVEHMAQRLASSNVAVEIETTDDLDNIALYDRVVYDGKRGMAQVFPSGEYRVMGMNRLSRKLKLRKWSL